MNRCYRLQVLLAMICVLSLCFVCASCLEDNDDDDDQADDDDETGDDDTGDDDTGDDDDDTGGEPPLPPYVSPDQRGPYEVGVITELLTDESRFELWGMRDRLLPLEIWYPSTGENGFTNRILDMIGPVAPWVWGVLEEVYGADYLAEMMNTETTALRGADLLVSEYPRPVIFFSHGLTAIRFQNYTLCEHLASHGFIVVAVDHFGNAIFTNDQQGRVNLTNPVAVLTSYFDRVIDVDFIYKWLVAQNQTPGALLEAQLDMARFGLTGHSYGGLTTMLAGSLLPYVGSIAPLNPAWIGSFPADFDKPFFMLQGDMDNIVGENNPASFGHWDRAISEKKFYVNTLRGGHYSVTDACLLLPASLISPTTTGCSGDAMISNEYALEILNAYLTAFFKATTAGDDRYVEFMRTNLDLQELETACFWPEP